MKRKVHKYNNGTEGITSNDSIISYLKNNTRDSLTPEQLQNLSNSIAKYSKMSGAISPVMDIKGAADFTPIGNILSVKDIYDAVSYNDYVTAGLIGASLVVPPVLSKSVKKLVPSFVTAATDKLNALRRKERNLLGGRQKVYQDVIEQRNRVIEDLYTNSNAWKRAEDIKRKYGDDYPEVYKNVLSQYENNYFGLPEPTINNNGTFKARMNAKKGAIDRYVNTGKPAGYNDFEYQINDNVDIDYPTTVHELGHYVDFNLSRNPNSDYGNNMFKRMKEDLSTEPNRIFPEKTDYFRTGSEQKSYMNTLRRFMLDNNIILDDGQKVSTKKIKRALDMLPNDMKSIKAAYEQFKDPNLYTKWFNKIPLLGTIPVINKINEENKSN